MICAHCRRPLKHPAAKVGRLLFGPVCARQLGMLAPAAVRATVFDVRSRGGRDERTQDMFEKGAACAA